LVFNDSTVLWAAQLDLTGYDVYDLESKLLSWSLLVGLTVEHGFGTTDSNAIQDPNVKNSTVGLNPSFGTKALLATE